MSYNELKRRCLERFFSRTNERQREAIFQTQGAVLIIAGAGSGKTTVLCNRIANLLLFGDAYNSDFEPVLEDDERLFLEQFADGELEIDSESTEKLSRIIGFRRAKPWKILAVTFTNKAAAELKERLSRMNAPADEVWASTFHSACVKILRRGIENIGYKSTFTIYDTDDSQRVIKDVMKYLGISDKAFSPKDIANKISRAKDKLIRPEDYPVFDEDGSKGDFMARRIKEVYTEYQKRLRAANALDFDDIIMKTVELFETSPDVLQYWQEKFDYVMVDEYQDTNGAQYRLVSLLAGKSGNLCVVGDEDQSIYRFRGATIENILSFEKQFDAHAIKLEQNYRSTQTILNAANAVISNNSQRKGKNLWSDMGDGDKISLHLFSNEQLEATFVADTVMKNRELGGEWKDNVVLYRTNSQSRTIELALSRQGIPYRIFGGTKFYERKEIKDILAYMSVINNPFDTVRFKRIINEPKRGIGDSTQATILEISDMLGISPVEVLERADEFAGLSRKAMALVALGQVFRELMSRAEDSSELDSLIDDILSLTGYEEALAKEGDEGKGRLENIKELKSGIINFLEENPTATLSDYLEQIALITDLDSYNEDDDKVVLMTMHGAKGLEFNTVFLVGAEENLFPSSRSAFDPSEVEEERRLAYVAITRAKKQLYITHARERLLYGQTQRNKVSRFVTEIPEKYLSFENHTQPVAYSSATFVKKSSGGYLQQQEQQRKAVQSALSGAQTLNVGERVYHKAFGSGTVISVTKMANDQLVEIAFDKVGTKKLMANFAKLIKE